MPGLTLWLTSKTDDRDLASRFESAQKLMTHTSDYAASVRVAEPEFFLGHVNYQEYPARCIEANDHVVYLEGRVYNKNTTQVESELSGIAGGILRDPTKAAALIQPWILDSEGEYVVAIAEPAARNLFVFTDPFGRLPLYYYADDSCLLIARECKFVQKLKPRPAFDKLGWAEMLSLKHLLGRRTLFEDVRSAPGGMMLHARSGGGRICTAMSSLFTFNFEEKDTPGRNIRTYASDLVDLFRLRCRQWGSHPDATENVLSLSGGKDARVIAAAMAKEGVPCVAATYIDPYGTAAIDARVAEQLAAALGLPWRLFRLPAPTRAQTEFLVRIKDGLNPAANAKMLPYLEEIVTQWGRGAVYISGDGGDFSFPDLRVGRSARSIDHLVRAFLAPQSATTPVAEAEAMVGLPRGAVESELRDLLAGYPETGIMQKAIHFRVYERGQNWVFTGEDRSRFFLWQSTPHYSFSVFRYCMRIPDHQKACDALYREFMRAMCPRWADLPEANLGLPLTSRYRPWKYRVKESLLGLPMPLRRAARLLLKGRHIPHQAPDDIMDELRAHLDPRREPATILSPDAVDPLLKRATRLEFENFWTLVLLEKLSQSW